MLRSEVHFYDIANPIFDGSKVTSMPILKAGQNKAYLLFQDVTKDIESLKYKWKRYTDSSRKETLKKLMHKSHRIHSYLKLKRIVLHILKKMRMLFSMIDEYMVRMDVWLLNNEVKSLMECIDSFFYAISTLKSTSTWHAYLIIKESKRMHEESFKENIGRLQHWQGRLQEYLPECKQTLEHEYNHSFQGCKKLFELKALNYDTAIEGNISSNKRQGVPNEPEGKGTMMNEPALHLEAHGGTHLYGLGETLNDVGIRPNSIKKQGLNIQGDAKGKNNKRRKITLAEYNARKSDSFKIFSYTLEYEIRPCHKDSKKAANEETNLTEILTKKARYSSFG